MAKPAAKPAEPGRHRAARGGRRLSQLCSAASDNPSYARYVGRVGVLAVALGVGAAVASSPGVAWAGPDTETTSPADSTAEKGGTTSDTTPDTTPSADTTTTTDNNNSRTAGLTNTATGNADPEPSSPTQHSDEVAPGVVVSHSGGVDTSGDTDEPKVTSTDPSTKPKPASKTQRNAVNNDNVSQTEQTHAIPQAVVGTSAPTADVAPAARSIAPDAKTVPSAGVTAPVVERVALEAVSDTTEATDEPGAQKNVVTSVLAALAATFDVTGNPEAPVELPAVWVLAAAAFRQFGQADTAREATRVPAHQTMTSDTSARAIAAAATVNLPPVIDDYFDATLADPATGAVTLVGLAYDPEGKRLSYVVVSGPAQGKLVFNGTTRLFTYTPTAAQRVIAGLSPDPENPQTVSFVVRVSDGWNRVSTTVTVEVAPTVIADVGDVATGAGALGVAVTATRAYVANADAATVTVIDIINRTKITDIIVDGFPMGIAVSPDGSKVYVTGQETNTVSVIDATTNTVSSKIQLGNRSPQLMAISKDGKTLYVTTTVYDPVDDNVVISSGITKISTSTNKITGTVKNVGLVPYQITVSPDGKKIYVIAEVESDTDYRTGVFVFSPWSSSAKQILAVGDRVESMDVSADSKRLYVGDFNSGVISVIDTGTNKIIDTIQTDPETIDDLVVNKDGSLLMVLNFVTHAVDVYDTTDDYALLYSVPTNATTEFYFPEAVLSSDGRELYYTSDGALQIISLVPNN